MCAGVAIRGKAETNFDITVSVGLQSQAVTFVDFIRLTLG